MKTHLLPWILVLAPGMALAQENNEALVAKQLTLYYEKGTSPPWEAAVEQLTAKQPQQRDGAAKYLVALLQQAQTDEVSGKAPWHATPFWGSSGENPARNLRRDIAAALAKAKASTATLTVVKWYLDFEKLAHFQKVAFKAVDKVAGDEAGKFCASLLDPAHENSAVVVAALKQIGKRKTAIPDAVLKSLCDHHRPSVRDAARTLNKDLGGAEPAPFDGAKAVQRPALAKLMADIGVLLDETAPMDAEFVKVTTKWSAKGETETYTKRGWLVKVNDDSFVVLTPFGHRETFPKEKTTKKSNGDVVVKNTWVKYAIADEVKRVVDLRKKNDPDFELSERGGLTGQFQGSGVGVYEIMLAHWLYATKRYELCAQILLPALDTVYADRHVVEMARHRFGETAGYKMLVAFVGDRDFSEALRLANALVQHYPGTRFHHYAVKLAKELPQRGDDFKKLKLPTPAEWTNLKKKLNRTKQIEFLAERIRLLNCFQHGQPGGYSLSEKQFAEPCGLSRNAAWGLAQGKTHVINPYVELIGGREGYFQTDDERAFKGMELTVADIPILAPHLRDDWHLLCVSFWRDFAPDRHLETTRPLFVEIINGLAKKDICSASEIEKMIPAAREKEIERIINWAKKNLKKSDGDLLLEGLEAEWQPDKVHWYWLKTRFTRLIELKEKRAVPLLHRHLDDPKTSSEEVCFILSFGRQLDAESFKKKAEKLVVHDDLRIQQQAALILHATGERKLSHEAFTRVLEKGYIGYGGELQTPEVLNTLVKENTPAARKVLIRITQNPRLLDLDWDRAWLLRILAEAKLPEAYLYYVPLLEIKGSKIGKSQYAKDVVVAEIIADEIVRYFMPKDPELIRIKEMFPKAADQIAPLKEWLKAKAKVAASEK
jgi:hypothetical protein